MRQIETGSSESETAPASNNGKSISIKTKLREEDALDAAHRRIRL